MSFNPMLNETSYNDITLIDPKFSGTVTVGNYTLPTSLDKDNKVLTATSGTLSAWEYSPYPIISMYAAYFTLAKNIGDTNFLQRNTSLGNVYYSAWNGTDRWVALTSTGTFYSLNDGATWTACATTVATPDQNSGIAYDSSTGIWVANVGSGTYSIWYSTDGDTFISTPNTNTFTAGSRVANDNNGTWVATGYNSVVGYTISVSTNPLLGEYGWFGDSTHIINNGLIPRYANGIWLAGGVDTSDSIFWSTDMIVWLPQSSPHTTYTKALCYSPQLDIWCSGGLGTFVLGYNTDPTTQAWTGSPTTISSACYDITWDNKRFIAIFLNGTIAYSYDGRNWSSNAYSGYLNLTPSSGGNSIRSKIYPRT